MSSKSTKKSTSVASTPIRVSSSTAKSSTPPTQHDQPAAGASTNTEQTAHSPAVSSRMHEKEELANLNDRLACYIDRVRNLETENARLSREVRTSQESITREVSSVKTVYEQELSEARKLVDELSNEKAKLEIDAKRLFTENGNLRDYLEKKNKEYNLLKANYSFNENQLSELTSKQNKLLNERNKLLDESKKLEEEKNALSAEVAKLQRLLEQETFTRIEHENALQTAREELAFREQVHQQEMTECRTRRHVELSEIDGRLSQEYDEKLSQTLRDVREQCEADLENNREEIKKLYLEKVTFLESQLSRRIQAFSLTTNEMKDLNSKINDLNNRLAAAETEKSLANQRARELENQVERLKVQYAEELAQHNLELSRLREEMVKQVKEYEDLMGIKVALDLEIAAYRKLLEGEEARLKITPSSSGAATPRPHLRAVKRKRVFHDESEETSTSNYCVNSTSKGDVEFVQVEREGKVVRLLNKGNKELSLGGWQIVRKTDDSNAVTYKFHRSLKMDAGNTVTVWSSDTTDQAHEPPENLVMKGQKWPVADHMTTTLLNNSGEEVASIEHTKKQSSSSISRQSSSLGAGSSDTAGTGGYFQKRSYKRLHISETSEPEEKCVIM